MDVNVLRQIMQQRAGMPSGGGQGSGMGAGQAPPAPQTSQPGPGPQLPPGTMSEQPMAQMNKSLPGEALTIIKGLVNRLRALPPSN